MDLSSAKIMIVPLSYRHIIYNPEYNTNLESNSLILRYDIEEWCKNNCTIWEFKENITSIVFENDSDGILFKLRWN